MLSRFASRAICSRKFLPDWKCVRTEFNLPYMCENECKVIKQKSAIPFKPDAVAVTLEGADVAQPLPFYGPERDNVNFPRTVRYDVPTPTRLGFIPDEWFRYLYPKMGVSGPYTLGILFYCFLVSKEIYIVGTPEHEHFIAFWMWVYVIIKSPLGGLLTDILNKHQKDFLKAAKIYETETLDGRKDAIDHEKNQQWHQEGKQLLYDAKKENVGLQLEAAYRNNVMELYRQMKRRLDYQVEVGKIDSRIKQKFMVDWVIARVQESIAKTSEKDTLKQCIADLNVLAARV